MDMTIKRAKPITGNSIAQDYYSKKEQLLLKRFASFPNEQGLADHARKVSKTEKHRRVLSQCLGRYNRRMGAGRKTLDNIALLENEGCTAVVTGQQTGLLTGPALTVYKAMTAVALSHKLQRQHKKPVVPIFWMASEDHDFAEVNRLHLISSKRRQRSLTTPLRPQGRPSVGCIEIENPEQLIAHMGTVIPETENNIRLLEQQRELALSSQTLCDWFARTMLKLFENEGLIILDPMLPQLRQLAGPLIEQTITDNVRLQAAAVNGAQEMKSLGYEPAIKKQQGHMHLFFYTNGDRVPLYLHDGKVSTRSDLGNWEYTLPQLIDTAKRYPERFSPGVSLRPVLQDYLLPTAAFVAGPGEINYLAQLKEIYQVAGVPMPPIFPRAQITVVGRKESEVIEQLYQDDRWLAEGFGVKLREYVGQQMPIHIEEQFTEIEQTLKNQYQQLINSLTSMDKKYQELGKRELDKTIGRLEYMKKKAWQTVRQQHKSYINRVTETEAILLPSNKPQEQIFSFYSLLFYFGEDLLNIFRDVDFTDGWSHQIYTLK